MVFFADASPVRSYKDAHHVVLDLVSQFVSFVFIERNYKVAQAVGVGLQGLFGLQELDGRWDFAGKDSGGVLAQLI